MPRAIVFESSLGEQLRDASVVRSEGNRGVLLNREREVGSAGDEPVAPVPDDYATRLVKYIPAEVLAVYIAMNSILAGASSPRPALGWLVFGFCLLSTPLYIMRVGKAKGLWQPLVSAGAFFVWVFALGGPFTGLGWYDPIYGALLLPAYTFLLPLVVKPPAALN